MRIRYSGTICSLVRMTRTTNFKFIDGQEEEEDVVVTDDDATISGTNEIFQ